MRTLIAIFFTTCLLASAAQITPGRTWVDLETVTATKLNTFLTGASINSTFISGAPETTTPGGGLYLVTLSGTTFYKATLGNLVFDNTNLVYGQTEDTAPNPNADRVLTWDSSGSDNSQTIFSNLLFGAGVSRKSSGLTNSLMFSVHDGTNQYWTYFSDLFNGPGTATNFSASDYFIKYSDTPSAVQKWQPADMIDKSSARTNSVLGTHKFNVSTEAGNWGFMTLNSIFIGSTASNAVTGGDKLLMYSTNASNVVSFPVSAIANYITNASNGFFTNYIGTTNAIAAAGLVVSNAHGLGVVPKDFRAVLVNAITTNGFVAGSELNPYSIGRAADGLSSPPMISCDSTNVYFALNPGLVANVMYHVAKDGTGLVKMDTNIWRIKFYARP